MTKDQVLNWLNVRAKSFYEEVTADRPEADPANVDAAAQTFRNFASLDSRIRALEVFTADLVDKHF